MMQYCSRAELVCLAGGGGWQCRSTRPRQAAAPAQHTAAAEGGKEGGPAMQTWHAKTGFDRGNRCV